MARFRIQGTALRQIGRSIQVAPGAEVLVKDPDGDEVSPYRDTETEVRLGSPVIVGADGAYDFYVDVDVAYYDLEISTTDRVVDQRIYVSISDADVTDLAADVAAVDAKVEVFYDTLAAFQSETVSAIQARYGASGTLIATIRENNFAYSVDLAQSALFDITTSGGVRVTALPGPDGFITFRQIGAIGDGSTDCRAAFNVASGRKCRGRAGDVYFIDINAPGERVLLTSGTDWDFPEFCEVHWDYFGAPLFLAVTDDDDVKIKINRPQIVWNGTFNATEPNGSASATRTAIGAVGTSNSTFAYLANFAMFGVDDLQILNPKFRVGTPGGASRAIPSCITIGRKPNDTMAKRCEITNIDASDYHFGVLGGGYEELLITGTHKCDRYDDYSDESWVPPGHFMYITTDDNEHVEIGNIYDRGRYNGYSADAPYFCVKLTQCTSFSVGNISSQRPHGCLMIQDAANGIVGDLFWRNTSTTVGNRAAFAPFYFVGLAGSALESASVKSITAIMPELAIGAVEFACDSAENLKNVSVKSMTIDQDATLFVSSGNCVIVEGQNTQVTDLSLNLRGPATRSPLLINTASDNCYVGYRLIGDLKTMRVGTNATDALTPSVVQDLTVRQVANPLGSFEYYSDIGANGFLKADVAYTHSSQSANDKFTGSTSYSEGIQLPGAGDYLVIAKWLDGSATNGRKAFFYVSFSTERNTYGSVIDAGPDIVFGTICTDVAATVTSAGVLSITSTWSSTRSCGLAVKFTKIGAE